MTIAHLLPDFAIDPLAAGAFRMIGEEAMEEQRLKAFEEGYSAGWDDAVTAQSEDHARISQALSRTLEDLSFTYQEAASQMTLSLEPMFQSLVDTVLPETMDRSFSQHVVEQLKDMARDQTAQPALLVVPAGAGKALKPVLEQQFAFPVQLVEEAALAPNQACLRLGNAERDVDCGTLLNAISEAMDAFLHQAREETLNG